VDREITAHWYRTRTFHFENATDRRWIRKFREKDIFNKRLVLGDLVQNVEITISESDVRTPTARKKMQQELDALEGVGNRSALLKIEVPNEQQLLGSCHRACVEILRPLVRRLRGKGFVRVKVWQRGNASLGWKGKDCIELFDQDVVAKTSVKANTNLRSES
jgi:hypothetical protein